MAERHVQVGDEIVEIWISGPLTTARAVATALLNNNNRKQESGIFLGDEQIHLNLATHYTLNVQRHKATAIGIATRCRLILNQATGKANPAEPLYLITPESMADSEHAPSTFFPRLFGATKMPFQPDWADWMWKDGFTVPQNWKGRELWTSGPLIKEYEGDDLFAYRIRTDPQQWLTIVRRHLDLVHHIEYNPHYANRWRRSIEDERRAFAEHDPRFPDWRNVLADGKATWVHQENDELIERGSYERYTDFDYMITSAASKAGIEAVIDKVEGS